MTWTPSSRAEAQTLTGAATCVVFRAGNPAEAFAIGDRLSAADIPYCIEEKWSFAYDGAWGVSSGGDWGDIVVFEDDRDRAAQVVAEFLQTRTGTPS